jgi:hypothetical protein
MPLRVACIDGALAAEWLAAFSKRFENPMWMIV